MYDKVVVGFDGSPESGDALRLARALAEPGDWGLIVTGVVERGPVRPPGALREDEAIAEAAWLSARAGGDAWSTAIRNAYRGRIARACSGRTRPDAPGGSHRPGGLRIADGSGGSSRAASPRA